MLDSSVFIVARNAFIRRLSEVATSDGRIVACWLQGSLGDGTADELSDVDASLVVEDQALDTLFAERRQLVGSLGTVLFFADGTFPGLRLVHCIFEGAVKLDLPFLKSSEAGRGTRSAFMMLVDKADFDGRLMARSEPVAPPVGPRIQALYTIIRQGGLWPIRLLLRGQWAVFGMCELELINDNLATLMAVQIAPVLLSKNRFSIPLLLRPEQQADLDELNAATTEALARRDLPALRDVHLRIQDALVREGRDALQSLGLPYPGTEEGDAGLREMYVRHWPEQVPVDRPKKAL